MNLAPDLSSFSAKKKSSQPSETGGHITPAILCSYLWDDLLQARKSHAHGPVTELLAIGLCLRIPALVVLETGAPVIGEDLGILLIGFGAGQVGDVNGEIAEDELEKGAKAFKDGGKQVVVEVHLSLEEREGLIYQTLHKNLKTAITL